MKQAIANAVGRVHRDPSIVTPDNGRKPFLAFTLALTQREYNGKTYSQRVYVSSYSRNMDELHDQLQPGMLVSVFGPVDAFVQEVEGKHYANLRLVANTIEIIPEHAPTRTANSHPAPAASPTQSGNSDDVPF